MKQFAARRFVKTNASATVSKAIPLNKQTVKRSITLGQFSNILSRSLLPTEEYETLIGVTSLAINMFRNDFVAATLSA